MGPRAVDILLYVIASAQVAPPVLSMRIGPGSIISNHAYEFVAKFAFSWNAIKNTEVGSVSGTIEVEHPAFLAMYDDQGQSWNHIYKNQSLSCDWALIPYEEGGPCKHKWRLEPGKRNVIQLGITEHLVSRFWYFAIIAETCGDGLPGPPKAHALATVVSRRHLLTMKKKKPNNLEKRFPIFLGGAFGEVVALENATSNMPTHQVPMAPREAEDRSFHRKSPRPSSSYDDTVDLSSLHYLAGTEKISKEPFGTALGKVTVDMTFVNLEQGWQKHFGFDELGVLPWTILLIFVYSGFLAYQLATEKKRTKLVIGAIDANYVRREESAGRTGIPFGLSRNAEVAPLVRIHLVLVVLELASLVLRAGDLSAYAFKGTTATRWHWGRSVTVGVFSHSLNMLSRFGLVLVIMLVARGWTISSGPDAIRGGSHVLLIFSFNCLLEICANIWICLTWDPASSLYGYTAPGGMVVVLWRIILLVWFLKNLLGTLAEETDLARKHLYRIFALVFSCWFLALPLVVLVLTPPLAPVWRYKISRYTLDLMHFVALSAFGIIFWPAWSDRYFDVRGPEEEIKSLLGGIAKDDSSFPSQVGKDWDL